MVHIPGFEPVAALGYEGDLVQLIARKQLTKLLSKIGMALCM
jgi:hypothetical protein